MSRWPSDTSHSTLPFYSPVRYPHRSPLCWHFDHLNLSLTSAMAFFASPLSSAYSPLALPANSCACSVSSAVKTSDDIVTYLALSYAELLLGILLGG